MRYGFCLPHHRPLATRELILEAARRAEDGGYDTIWLNDHIAPPSSPEQQHRRIFFEPLALAGFVAAVAPTPKIGFSVLVLPYRHPVVTAKQLATIDVMTGGRLLFGIGVGYQAEEFAAVGADFPRRGAITDEYLQAIVELWTKEAPRFAGPTVSFQDVSFWPKPVQRPHPPILVGGHGRIGIRRTVALGDAWYPDVIPLDELRGWIAELHLRWTEAGRPGTPPVYYRRDVRFTDTPSSPRQPFEGTPRQIIEDLEACAEMGVTEVALDFAVPPDLTAEDWLRNQERFTREVRPHAT
ncbi:MAG: TIGR03619 family F420-dependent LLM class oxidoreductase [Chloroflexota bacterium]